jgi:hypothetical protein
MTDTMWRRLAALPERIRIRDERRKRRYRVAYVGPRFTAGDRRMLAHFRQDRHEVIGCDYAARFLRVPLDRLLAATKDQDFYLDFGLGHEGEPLRFFRVGDLMRFVKSQLRVPRVVFA